MRWWTEAMLDELIAEDARYGDLTTDALGMATHPARLHMSMRADATVCGTEVAQALFERVGVSANLLCHSGTRVPAGGAILSAEGPAGGVFTVWKVAQTLVEYLSGIATATAAIVTAAREIAPHIAVVTTRKTLPGAKAQMIAAIRAGGAFPHRLGLSETLLVFPEHRAFLNDAVARIAALRKAMPEKKVVVEVKTLEEVERILPARPDVFQCEKMSPDDIRAVVGFLADKQIPALVAAAGGVNAQNAAAYAGAGADILVSSAPYWAKPSDVKVVIDAL